jgi:hypothetical protein
MLGYGILGLVAGVKMFVPTWKASEMQKITAGALQRGERPQSYWVSIHGRLLWDWAAVDPDPISGGYYVPLVPSNYTTGPIPVIVFVGNMKGGDLGEYAAVDGLIQWSDLPLMIQMQLQQSGLPLKENFVYLEYGRDPLMARRFSLLLILTSLASIGGFVYLTQTIKRPMSRLDGYQLRRQVRTLGETEQYDENGQRIITPQEAQRNDAIQQWMREHGLAAKKSENTAATDDEPHAEPATVHV